VEVSVEGSGGVLSTGSEEEGVLATKRARTLALWGCLLIAE